jgi:hypothetical protein
LVAGVAFFYFWSKEKKASKGAFAGIIETLPTRGLCLLFFGLKRQGPQKKANKALFLGAFYAYPLWAIYGFAIK